MGKPADKNEVLDWLLVYSGKIQKVHTDSCIYSFEKHKIIENWTSTTTVHFKNYGAKEALGYLDSEPAGFINKAGGYGIQDATFSLYSKIEGDFSNVVGLPLKDLAKRPVEQKDF